jgi:hypothetical protein
MTCSQMYSPKNSRATPKGRRKQSLLIMPQRGAIYGQHFIIIN